MPREPFQLNVDVLISDTRDLMPIQDAMTRPLESVLRAFGEAINVQLREDFIDDALENPEDPQPSA